MTHITIPLAVLHAPEYQSMQNAEKVLLIDLYKLFSDCDRFSMDTSRPQDYQIKGINLPRRIASLVASGLIVVDGRQEADRPGWYRRVFRFKFPALEAMPLPPADNCIVALRDLSANY